MKRVVKKSFIFISILIIFLVSIIPIISIGSTPSINGHTADEILITIKGYTMTLQEAISPVNYFSKSNRPSSNGKQNVLNGHLADKIEIIVNNRKMTLQSAINSLKLYDYDVTTPTIFCPGGSSANFNINPGHDSYEISINGGTKTLQQAINAGDFCPSVSEIRWIFLGGSAGCQSQYVDCPCALPHVNCKSCTTIGAQCKVCAGAWTNKYECRQIKSYL